MAEEKLAETEMCGVSRERVRKFRDISFGERDALSKEERHEIKLAFYHIEMCFQGKNMPNMCNYLWQDMRPLTNIMSEKYDREVANYFAIAKSMAGSRPWTQQEPGMDY